MRITLTKHPTAPVIACTRRDGSVTWQKSAHGPFFGPHDLLHYALESTLNLRESFFGLIARGRSIESFAEPGTAAQLPVEAMHTEMMVNQLMIDHIHGPALAAAEFNQTIAASWRASKPGAATPPNPISDSQLQQIHERFAELLQTWRSLADGEKLELEFPG